MNEEQKELNDNYNLKMDILRNSTPLQMFPIKKQEEIMKKVIIDDVEFYPQEQKEQKGNVKIVILQRGWNMVGRFERNGSDCKLYDASVIRNWGTTNGLGEIALNGPTRTTKLDPCNGTVEFDYLTVVATIACDEAKWQKSL